MKQSLLRIKQIIENDSINAARLLVTYLIEYPKDIDAWLLGAELAILRENKKTYLDNAWRLAPNDEKVKIAIRNFEDGTNGRHDEVNKVYNERYSYPFQTLTVDSLSIGIDKRDDLAGTEPLAPTPTSISAIFVDHHNLNIIKGKLQSKDSLINTLDAIIRTAEKQIDTKLTHKFAIATWENFHGKKPYKAMYEQKGFTTCEPPLKSNKNAADFMLVEQVHHLWRESITQGSIIENIIIVSADKDFASLVGSLKKNLEVVGLQIWGRKFGKDYRRFLADNQINCFVIGGIKGLKNQRGTKNNKAA